MTETEKGRWFQSPGVWAAIGILTLGVYLFSQGRLLRGFGVFVAGLLVAFFFSLPRRKYFLFAGATVMLATLLPVGSIVGLDVYLHRRYASTGGYNVSGYRGAVVGRKQPGERRIAVLGGSAAFGYGVKTDETFPWYLERTLNQHAGQAGPVTVVNLAWNGEGAYSFRFTLQDYDYLEPDFVILYSGYNDLSFNNQVFRRQSAIFRLTGYLPILPVVPIREWLHVDDLSATSSNGKVVFRPNLVDRSATQAADMALQVTQALERQLVRLSAEQQAHPTSGDAECGNWTDYCHSVHGAVRYALDRNRHVIVVTEPYVGGGEKTAGVHLDQQSALLGMLAAKFPAEPRLHYINMGRSVNLRDRALCYDGMHLTAEGNARLAASLAPEIEPILAEIGATADAAANPRAELVQLFEMPEHAEFALATQAETAAATGRMREARTLTARAVKEAQRRGLADAAAIVTARQALAESIVGNRRQAVDAAAAALDMSRRPGPVWAAALVYAVAGDVDQAAALTEEFAQKAPSDRFVRGLWLPMLRAGVELSRGNPENALRLLEPTVIYEGGTYWSRYLRGVCHLRMGHGFEAEQEFMRIRAQPGVGPNDPVYIVSQRQLARARVLRGAAALYGETYQQFFLSWKQADADVPVLQEAKAEYLELRKSIGLPPLPF